mmetsp:Transcript_81976/g.248591  ORF Transcript_81976/g.248591 Transcript_81976/m.248591 type:complete len:623 (-) Transcript_81976:159-2027(-)
MPATPCPPSPCFNNGDSGAGPQRRISLSNPGWLPTACCWIPGLIIFSLLFTIVGTACFWRPAFYAITAALTAWTVVWSSNLCISTILGFLRMRRAVGIDWHAKLTALQAESPESSSVMHIVIMPNYNEDEDMMRCTLENLARSRLAHDSMYVVLAMEEREGPVAREKAARLIDSTRHLFADIFATFHVDRPGDVTGKSSNCQWAFRQQVQRLEPQLRKYDTSQIFITCCDADALFHPQYFSALSYQALGMPCHDRVWSLWQPPILLLRNLFSAPGPTRLTGYATILFELGGLANQKFAPHMAYSAYTCTFALASHHLINGWDRDVIAEDHHMFCKCYFASVWEQLETLGSNGAGASGASAADVKPMLRLSPVYLPALSYLVQSDDGWLASLAARFTQARRHSQGLAELSYVVLQHIQIVKADRLGRIRLSTHARILSLAGKMAAVHIIASLHSMATILATLLVVLGALQWVFTLGVDGLLQTLTARGLEGVLSLQSLEGVKWSLCTIFGAIPPLGIMLSLVAYMVVKDTLEGKLTRDVAISQKVDSTEPVAPDVQGCAKGSNGLGLWKSFQLLVMLQVDHFGGATIAMVGFCLIPALLASWSLMFKKGSGFKYVVGSKPKAA